MPVCTMPSDCTTPTAVTFTVTAEKSSVSRKYGIITTAAATSRVTVVS